MLGEAREVLKKLLAEGLVLGRFELLQRRRHVVDV